MKQILLTTIAALVLVGCGKSVPNGSIHDAAKVGNIELINQHLETGVNVNSKDEIGFTPLHYIASGSQPEIAKLLIDKGADVNAKDLNGGTPLHAATPSNQSTKIVELLVQKGANVNAKNNNGETPLDKLGSSNWSTSTEDILRENGGKTSQELKSAEANTKASLEESPKEAEATAFDGSDISIFLAADAGNIGAVKKHLASGEDVNAQDPELATPLHYAASTGHKEVAELLIEKGATVNALGVHGTPLDNAIGQNHTKTADLLRKHGGKTSEELKAEGK
jgi:ankyrin repeat protein